ncbi:hypothetical protein BN1263500290 [Stenotrophomonas indicatrix]|nr:hypothetical protein BN1263500290 [Stenotrophomonas indicatrix]
MQPAAAPLFSGKGNGQSQGGSGLLLAWRGGGRWRDTPQVRPCRLGHGIHAVDGPAIGPLPASDNFPVTVGGSTPCVDEGVSENKEGSDPFSKGKRIRPQPSARGCCCLCF